MKVAIIDYGAGNTQSVRYAFDRLGCEVSITSDQEQIRSAEAVIFPGVGNALPAMRKLRETGLDQLMPELKQPVLGICLGMQLMCDYTEEGDCAALGIFPEKVIRFNPTVKVPQIGWNQLLKLRSSLFLDVPEKEHVYFVHSYYVPESEFTIAMTQYGVRFSAALQKKNFWACQFHPEKSGAIGSRLLTNFLNLCASYQQ